MSREISQSAFNEIVLEIINDFDASPEEAVEDAIKQLEAQGVDLSNIKKFAALNLLPTQDAQSLESSLRNLDALVGDSAPKQQIISELQILCDACAKSTSHKTFMGNSDFVRIALDILQKYSDEKDIVVIVLKGLLDVTVDQPDVLSSFAPYCMASYLETEKDEECLILLLSWMRAACIKHEENRQNIVQADCIPRLKNVLEHLIDIPAIVKGVCSVFRALVLDDDIRVEFGHAHEHARKIADLSLITVASLLKMYKTDKDVVGESLLTLSALIVRNEYCEKLTDVKEGEVLSYVFDIFVNFPDSEKLNRQCLKLLKVLAGNDKVKAEIMNAGAASLIVMAMGRLQQSAQLVAAGNGCIAMLTLRSASNSKAFNDVDAPSVILDGMRTHKKDLNVQKQGCWAIRNMVSRNRDLCPSFLELGAEELINFILETFKDQCEYDAKAALRDLGCEVELREEWTGKGGALN